MKGARCRNGSAFTLLELLVVCTVLTLLVVLTARAFHGAMALWERSASRSEAYREGRAVCDLLWRDLSAVLPPAPEGPVLPVLVLDHPPQAPEEERAHEALSAAVLAPGSGEPGLVGYRVVWDAAARTYALRRSFRREGAAALASGGGQFAATFFADPPAEEETVAACVWDFTVRPALNGAAGPYPRQTFSTMLPAWVEIRFKVLGPAATRKLAGLPITRETWANPADPLYRRVILPHQETFFIRVPLGALGAPPP